MTRIKIFRLFLALSTSLWLTACDTEHLTQTQPQSQSRSMIIGGVPVHDKDFKLQPTSSTHQLSVIRD